LLGAAVFITHPRRRRKAARPWAVYNTAGGIL